MPPAAASSSRNIVRTFLLPQRGRGTATKTFSPSAASPRAKVNSRHPLRPVKQIPLRAESFPLPQGSDRGQGPFIGIQYADGELLLDHPEGCIAPGGDGMTLALERLGKLYGKVAEGLQQSVRPADQSDLCRRAVQKGGLDLGGAQTHLSCSDQGSIGGKGNGNPAVEGRSRLFQNRCRSRIVVTQDERNFIFPQRALKPRIALRSGQKEVQFAGSKNRLRLAGRADDRKEVLSGGDPVSEGDQAHFRIFQCGRSVSRGPGPGLPGSARIGRSGWHRRPKGRIRRGIPSNRSVDTFPIPFRQVRCRGCPGAPPDG